MANSKISALTSASTVVGTEVLPIVQSSATVKVSVANLTPGLNTITAAKGGTGQTSYAVGDLLYADTTTTLAKLADVVTGNALISGGVSTAPSYGKIGLTTHVSGTLPVANGGTATTTAFTAGSVVFAGASGVYSQNNASFFWDNTNSRLGINTSSPSSSLTAASTDGSAPSNSTGTSLLRLRSTATAAVGTGPSITFEGQTGNSTTNYAFAGIQGFKGSATASDYSGTLAFYTQNSGGSTLLTERMRITNTGGVSIATTTDAGVGNLLMGTGNVTQGTAAKGFNFTANTPAAGMTSQLLNWYEHGTWTPNQGGGLTVVGAFTSSGTYTRIGRQVVVNGVFNGATSIAVVAGGTMTSNLPFTVLGTGIGSMANSAFTQSGIAGAVGGGTSVAAASAITATASIIITITYFV
jgi:hypothetical protein